MGRASLVGAVLMLLVLLVAAPARASSVTITASRTSCAAPCGVFFDGTSVSGFSGATAILTGGDYVSAFYAWDFADPGSSHPTAIGFTVAHVFENAGTYVVTLNVHDSSFAVVPPATVTITVSAMSGTSFYAASAGSGTTCSIASPCSAATALTHVATNNSILFRNGDTFSGLSATTISAAGPVLIGGYSDPSAPSSVAPIISFSSGNWHTSSSDVRFVGIHTKVTGGNDGFDIGGTFCLLLRVEGEGDRATAVSVTYINSLVNSTDVYVVDSNLHNIYGYGWYSEGPIRQALIGTGISDLGGQDHAFRWQGCQSDVGSPTTCSAGTGSAFGNLEYVASNTINTPNTGGTGTFDAGTFRGSNHNFVYVGNSTTNYVYIEPQNPSSIEYVSNGLIEGNYMRASDNTLIVGACFFGKHGVFRNNVIWAPQNAAIASQSTGYEIASGGLLANGWIDEIYVLNNTFMSFNAIATSGMSGRTVVLQNDIVYNNSPYGGALFSGNVSTEDHNLTFAQNGMGMTPGGGTGDLNQDPLFTITPPTIATDVKLQSTSPAKNAGATVAAYYDYTGTLRPQGAAFDMGAWEYVVASSSNPPSGRNRPIVYGAWLLVLLAAVGLVRWRWAARQERIADERHEHYIDARDAVALIEAGNDRLASAILTPCNECGEPLRLPRNRRRS